MAQSKVVLLSQFSSYNDTRHKNFKKEISNILSNL